MCLYVNWNKTKKAPLTGSFTGWKVVCVYDDMTLNSIYYNYRWKVGVNRMENYMGTVKTNRLQADESHIRELYNGIHVYTKLRQANIIAARDFPSYHRLLPVKCFWKDLIAIGDYNEALLSKVTVLKEDYDKAIPAFIRQNLTFLLER